jgi:hypothetical protein
MAAPAGNNNAGKSRAFYGALSRAIAQDDGERLRRAAEKLLDLAAEGEAWAVKELRDTMDGKPAQVIAGDPEAPLFVSAIERRLVRADTKA